MRIVRRETALRDLLELASYIAEDNLEAAERFLDASESTFQFLLETPGAGVQREFLDPALVGLRMWPIRGFDKYLVFYREIGDGIEIIRVLHAARDIEYLFDSGQLD